MSDIIAAARALHQALLENTAFPMSLSNKFTLENSYEVQFALLRERVAMGEKHVGWKVGLTSKAMQEQQGVPEPCLGHLMAQGHLQSPGQLNFENLMEPGFENELCLRIGKTLSGDVSAQEALSAVEAIAPALEIVEKRGAFASDLPLAFAGNVQQRAFVTGPFTKLKADMDLATVPVEVILNGKSRERASGKEVLGSPVNSIIWLARKLAEFGHDLKSGDMVMSGSFTKQYSLAKSDRATAKFGELGEATIEIP